MNSSPGQSTGSELSNPPLVSIMMPLFNEAHFCRSVFEDLIGQTYRNIEILVCDNCSTDGTWEIVQEFAQRDARIHTHRHLSNIGAIGNYISALQMVRGEFIMMAAGHDHYLPAFVEACVAELRKDSAVVMAYPRANFMDMAGNVIGPCPTDLDTRGMISVSRVNVVLWGLEYPYQMYGVFRRSLFEDWEFKQVFGPDFLFLVRAALRGTFAQVPEVLLHMRRNKDHGDVDAFAKKLYINGVGPNATEKPDRLYYDLIREYIREIKTHLLPGTSRNSLVASVVLAMATRHDCQRNFARQIAGLPPAPAKSDLQSTVDRFASELEDILLTRDDAEEILHRKARGDILRQFNPDELVSLMTYRELVHGLGTRVKRTIQRRFTQRT